VAKTAWQKPNKQKKNKTFIKCLLLKNKAGKHYEQVKAESEIKNYDKSQPNEKMDEDLSWLDNYKNASKDFTTQEKKSTEKPEENTKSEGIPEFFLDKEKESEEKK